MTEAVSACRARLTPLVLAFAVASIALTVASCGGDGETEKPFGLPPSPGKNVSAVRLDDVSRSDAGRPTAPTARTGELMLVYFGFTTCPDICPTTLADLGTAIRALPASDRKRVTVALITVDPKRDSGKAMRSYLSHFFEDNPSLALRTDDREALAEAEEAFGASHKLGKPKRDGSYDVSHSAYTYAVDDSGDVVLEWPFGMRSADLSHDLKILLSK